MQKLSNSQFCKLNCEGSTPVVSRPWKSGWESSAKLKCARASLPHQYILAKHRPKVQACLKTLFWCSWPPHSAQKAVRMVLHDRACNHTPTMNKPDLELDFPSGIVRFLLHFGQIHFIPFQPYDIRGETVHDRIWSNQLRPGLLLHEALLLQLLLLLKLKLLLLLLLLLHLHVLLLRKCWLPELLLLKLLKLRLLELLLLIHLLLELRLQRWLVLGTHWLERWLGHKALLLLLLLLMQLELLVLWQQAVRIGRYVRSHVRSLESLLRLEALLEVVLKARLTRRIDLLILLILLEHLLMLLHLKLRLLCQPRNREHEQERWYVVV